MANSIGAEVGQKMRSAIKAKLLELNCYVDDELPDYIMVMVANKRTKSQMKDDLQLFLSNKTETFVDWLHIVLKKLKEVTVTNPDVYKKAIKRKSDEFYNNLIDIKKEKKDKVKLKDEPDSTTIKQSNYIDNNKINFESLTDNLPLNVNKLTEQRKIIVLKDNPNNLQTDNFDIPLLSEVYLSTEDELIDIEKKIKSVKSRLGFIVNDDIDNNDHSQDEIIKKIKQESLNNNSRKVQLCNNNENKNSNDNKNDEIVTKVHTPIVFDLSDQQEKQQQQQQQINKRKSILDRLGKKQLNNEQITSVKNDFKNKSKDIKYERDEKKKRENILNRLGVMSKVSIPKKDKDNNIEYDEEPLINREVSSVIKIRPRIIPPDLPQPNKNLLLKAVAEAQRSIAQTPTVGNTNQNNKPDALFTQKYKEKLKKKEEITKRLSDIEKNKIKQIIIHKNELDMSKYGNENCIHDISDNGGVESIINSQANIITLQGLQKNKEKPSIKLRLDKKRTPSPIIFNKNNDSSNIPEELSIIQRPSLIRNKERCKYWPNCRLNEKCQFFHPQTNCENFPNCKFGDKCLYIHSICKFGSSCTRRDCLYSHLFQNKTMVNPIIPAATDTTTIQVNQQIICKYVPNCNNLNCSFYHPKPCKFGQFCKNRNDCNFSHNITTMKKSNLIWKSK